MTVLTNPHSTTHTPPHRASSPARPSPAPPATAVACPGVRRMLFIALPTATTLPLPLHATLVLGRAHFSAVPGAASISRSAVTLRATGPRTVALTIVGKSATRFTRPGGRDTILPPGSVVDDIGPGDELQLSASAPDAVARVQEEGATADAPPPVKRPRVAEDALVPPDGPLMLILCGLPGAGKSTLAGQLVKAGGWTRVCRDTISAAGRKGTRAACVAAAADVLRAGGRCVIDRCNLTEEQRADFVAAAAAVGAPVHAIHLALQPAACAARAAARTSHEGGLTGATARAVVGRMVAAGVTAPGQEGFASVAVCTNDRSAAVAAARFGGPPPPPRPTNAFDVMMAARSTAERQPPPPPPPSSSGGGGSGGHSLHGPLNDLRAVAAAPASHPNATPVTVDGHALIILPDKYAKASRHALVLPVGPPGAEPDTPAALSTWPRASSLVRAMLAAGRDWAAAHPAPSGAPWRFGFHSVPSLAPLHLHVISQDLDSPALKTKKHYNSFKRPFFVDAVDVADALDAVRSLPLLDAAAADAALKAPLTCHRCGAPAANMPRLRDHVATCAGPWPAGAECV